MTDLTDLPRDGQWHRLARIENYTHRADKAHSLRQKARREGLPIAVRIQKPWIEARWDA